MTKQGLAVVRERLPEDATASGGPTAATTTVAEAALTIGGGFTIAFVVLQWLVPICFSC